MHSRYRRWFHPNINGQEAERMLLEHGEDGSFIVRPSFSKSGDFTLSVRRNNEITHIKIRNTGDFYDLNGGTQFATLSELIEHYSHTSAPLKEKSGEIIRLITPLCSPDPTYERWFHGSLNARETEELLIKKANNGSFLVRESQSKPGNYVVSVRTANKVTHVQIHYESDGKYDLGGGPKFDSLGELIEHYKRNSMVDNTGTVVQMRTPFNTTRVPALAIDSRIAVLCKETPERKSGFWSEFEFVQRQDNFKEFYTNKEGLKNKSKNRYKNILPFDYTRVVLRNHKDANGKTSDYINASYIKPDEESDRAFKKSEKKYIATQGPLAITVVDFWWMIWQENCRVIVMATKEVELRKSKCACYWPTANTSDIQDPPTKDFGQIRVCMVKERSTAEFMLREMTIENVDDINGEKRTVFQYHFSLWPDHNVPSDPSCVLSFLEEVNKCQESINEEDIGPLVVHCSAGIGRTGTLLVIDMIIDQIERCGLNCDIDIQRTIQHVRKQRPKMVQTEAQYKFVYLTIQHHISTLKGRLEAQKTSCGHEYTNIRSIPSSSSSSHPINNSHSSHLVDISGSGIINQSSSSITGPIGGFLGSSSNSGNYPANGSIGSLLHDNIPMNTASPLLRPEQVYSNSKPFQSIQSQSYGGRNSSLVTPSLFASNSSYVRQNDDLRTLTESIMSRMQPHYQKSDDHDFVPD